MARKKAENEEVLQENIAEATPESNSVTESDAEILESGFAENVMDVEEPIMDEEEMVDTEDAVLSENEGEEMVAEAEVESSEFSDTEADLSGSDEESKETERKLTKEEAEILSEGIDKAIIDLREMTARNVPAVSAEQSRSAKRRERKNSIHVVTEHGDETVETELTRKREERIELAASAHKRVRKILEGTVGGYRMIGNTLVAEIDFMTGTHSVVIPSYLLFNYNMEEYSTPEKMQIIERNVRSRIGSRVKFVVRTIDEKTNTAYADRLMALSMEGIQNYTSKNIEEEARVHPGVVVKADIVQVARTFIVVNALGAEFRIPLEELSWLHNSSARDLFTVGDTVNVKIKETSVVEVTKNDNKYKLIRAKGSVRETTKNVREANFAKYNIGDVRKAEVTYVYEKGIFVQLNNKQMDALVAAPRFGTMPKVGDIKVVRITGRDEENLFLYGQFVNN